MDILGKLFSSPARVKILRLFLLNPEEVFETRDVGVKSQVPGVMTQRELNCLSGIKLIKRKTVFRAVEQKKRKKIIVKKRKIRGWILNSHFFYLDTLKPLLISSKSFERDAIVRRFKNAGRLKLLVISGIFIQNNDSRADLLIVGDHLKKNIIKRAVGALESEIGKELRYGVLRTNDFLYRLDIYDKFVRDVLDYPHEKLVNKIGLK